MCECVWKRKVVFFKVSQRAKMPLRLPDVKRDIPFVSIFETMFFSPIINNIV